MSENKSEQNDYLSAGSPNKRSTSRLRSSSKMSGSNAGRDGAMSPMSDNRSSDKVKYNLNPKMMKGPNAALPITDLFCQEVQPEEWKNIPIPVCEAIMRVREVFLEHKKVGFENFNETVQTQRVINLN